MDRIEADVVVIGAGVTGTTIARELSRYKVETIVVEKGGGVGIQGQTKASSGMVYSGMVLLMSCIIKSIVAPDAPLYDPESQKIKWLNQGFDQAQHWIKELDVKCRPSTQLMIATNKEELKDLESFFELGQSMGGRFSNTKWADRELCLEMEPHLTKDVIAGVYSEKDAIQVLPWEIAMAQSESARQNGVRFMLNNQVTGIVQKNGYQIVETILGPIRTKFIVNAGGILADKVSDLAGERDWDLIFFRNLNIIMDRSVGRPAKAGLCLGLPPGPGKGAISSYTPDGNLWIQTGNYESSLSRDNMGAYPDEALRNVVKAKRFLPEVSEKDIIRSFVGMRVFNSRDQEENILEPLSNNPRFINAVVRLPGITPSVPIARHVLGLLGNAGLELTSKSDFNPYRKRIPTFRDLSNHDRKQLISRDARYGHVVCSCETITEGEIVEAIKRGARTITAVRYATRAGMGRCQGNYCSSHVASILARELDIPFSQTFEPKMLKTFRQPEVTLDYGKQSFN